MAMMVAHVFRWPSESNLVLRLREGGRLKRWVPGLLSATHSVVRSWGSALSPAQVRNCLLQSTQHNTGNICDCPDYEADQRIESALIWTNGGTLTSGKLGPSWGHSCRLSSVYTRSNVNVGCSRVRRQ